MTETRRRPARRAPLDPQRLTAARERAGLSMSELARRCTPELSPSHIDGLERSYHGASPGVVKRLAYALDLRVQDLLYE